jgi:hypothetical protein
VLGDRVVESFVEDVTPSAHVDEQVASEPLVLMDFGGDTSGAVDDAASLGSSV